MNFPFSKIFMFFLIKLLICFRCGGVEIDNIIFVEELQLEKECDIFMSRSFYPYNNMGQIDVGILSCY